MPVSLKNWLGLALIALCAVVVMAIGAASCFFAGFAWAVLICAFVGWLISRQDLGQNGEGAYVVVCSWILLAVGLAVGLVLRLVLK